MNGQIPPNDHVIDSYLRYHREAWRPGTTKLRTIQIRSICEALAPTPLALATEDEVLRWHDSLTGAPETRASYTSAARGLFRWMCTKARPKFRVDDPTAILDRPKVPPRPPRPMLDRHFDLALACAVSQPHLYAWLGLAGCSGLRCCEIAWLRAGDVEELEDGRGLLHIVGKGGKRRTTPAGETLMITLRPFLRISTGPVFTRPSDGQAHTPDRVSQQINDFLRSIGIRETAHTLRHRFGTDYHAIDADLYRQAKLMGHASVDTTQRYVEVSPLEAAHFVDELTRRRLRTTAHHGRVA